MINLSFSDLACIFAFDFICLFFTYFSSVREHISSYLIVMNTVTSIESVEKNSPKINNNSNLINSPVMKVKRSLSQNSRFNTNKKISCEEIINEMENEQDAIVVRLLREINSLKTENSRLRTQLNIFHLKVAGSNSNSNSHTTRYSSNDEEAITDDESEYFESNTMLTPRNSFNSNKLFFNNSNQISPASSRRPSTTNSNTIFPIATQSTAFIKPKRSSFSYTTSSVSNLTIENSPLPTTPISSRKRRTSSSHSLDNNQHFKNHEKKVNEILPSR